MIYRQYLPILLSFSLAIFPLISYTEETTQQPKNQITQIKTSLAQLKKSLASIPGTNPSYVYLGTSETKIQLLNDQLTQYQNQLNNFLATLDQHQLHRVSTLQWMPAQNTQIIDEKSSINAGDPNNPVYICRAPFIGLSPGNKAIYPGEVIKTGCRISYAGYAFSVSKFDILTGKNEGLQWIPGTAVNKAAHENIKNPDNAMIISRQQFIFNFDASINGAKAIAGGYQGGYPVLICRAKQNDVFVIGKVVLVDGGTGSVCDIGVDNKEFIAHNFEVLFKK